MLIWFPRGACTRLERPAEHGSPSNTRGRGLPELVWRSKRDVNREQRAMKFWHEWQHQQRLTLHAR
eukprot:367076-Amphidinium_carterae.2